MSFSFVCQNFPDKEGNTPRLGSLLTPHGVVETPAFIFCATNGAVKGLSMEEMRKENTQIILANTYHLMISPTESIVQDLGGLSKMCGWCGPTLTDSGGYQIFSMGYGSVAEEIKGNRRFPNAKCNIKILEEGVCFKSYVDGSKVFLSPEKSIEIQEKIGADLIVAFDECTPYHISRDYTANSMLRSHRWEKRSLLRFLQLEEEKKQSSTLLPQALYGVIQGGIYEDLRTESCNFVNQNEFFGHAIGGSLGADKAQMRYIVQFTTKLLSKNRPIHLLGIGKISDIFHGVKLGIDTFDCVHPTRIARHGCALAKGRELLKLGIPSSKEHINLKNSQFKGDKYPIEENCSCLTCSNYTRGYIHHLLKAKEMLASILISRHNVHFMNSLMRKIREGIKTGQLSKIEKEWII